jgi:hypothetical protein
MSRETLRSKADCAWELAGCAQGDDKQYWTDKAKEYEAMLRFVF